MDLLLGLELDHDATHLMVDPCRIGLISSVLHVEFNPQSVDQLAELRVFVEQLSVVLEVGFEFGLEIAVGVIFGDLFLV